MENRKQIEPLEDKTNKSSKKGYIEDYQNRFSPMADESKKGHHPCTRWLEYQGKPRHLTAKVWKFDSATPTIGILDTESLHRALTHLCNTWQPQKKSVISSHQ